MEHEEIDFIINCLPKGKTKFHYFKDKYALDLLKYKIGDGHAVSTIKKSNFGRLLQKPIIKEIISSIPNGHISPEVLDSHWPKDTETFLLTLGTWGHFERGSGYRFRRSYYQISSSGGNIVLQLNFSNKHNQPYYSLIKPNDYHPFEVDLHPICKKEGYHTLAWSRLEIDLEQGFCLIEEIQNDWLRLAQRRKTTVETIATHEEQTTVTQEEESISIKTVRNLRKYYHDVLKPYENIWDEAIMSATLWLLRHELGIKTIFYHTQASGRILKSLQWTQPPKSIYSQLPKKFLFEETTQFPPIFNKRRRKLVQGEKIRFFVLNLE